MDLARLLGVEANYSRARLGAVLGTTAVYIAAVLVLHETVGYTMLMLVTFPVLLTAWTKATQTAIRLSPSRSLSRTPR